VAHRDLRCCLIEWHHSLRTNLHGVLVALLRQVLLLGRRLLLGRELLGPAAGGHQLRVLRWWRWEAAGGA